MPKLSHDEMRAVIAEGGSVVHEGRIIARHEDLPSKADLAQHDEASAAAARDYYDEQIAKLAAERAKLDAPRHAHAEKREAGDEPPKGEEAHAETKAAKK